MRRAQTSLAGKTRSTWRLRQRSSCFVSRLPGCPAVLAIHSRPASQAFSSPLQQSCTHLHDCDGLQMQHLSLETMSSGDSGPSALVCQYVSPCTDLPPQSMAETNSLQIPVLLPRELSDCQTLLDSCDVTAKMASRGRCTGLCNCLLTAMASTVSSLIPAGGCPMQMLLVRLSSNSKLCIHSPYLACLHIEIVVKKNGQIERPEMSAEPRIFVHVGKQ